MYPERSWVPNTTLLNKINRRRSLNLEKQIKEEIKVFFMVIGLLTEVNENHEKNKN